jgi:glyoxylase-like metal-dependent hydrolase (beta-lactamase superfamily II)
VDVGPENAYYEVFKVMDNVYAIFEPYNWQQVISYLIIGEEKAMLFDTGMDVSPIDRVVKKLTNKPVFDVLSHSHFDHVGGAHLFDEVWGMDEPWANKNASGGATDYAVMFTTPESFWEGHVPEDFDLASYKIENYTVTHYYKEGDIIDLGNRQLEVVAAPGHSLDGIVLVDRANRLMWTGDVFYVGPLFAFLEEADMEVYAQTASKLAEFADDVDYLLPTHNTTMEPSGWLTKMNAAFKALASGEKTDFNEGEGYREYVFDGFQIWAKPPAE